MKEEKVSRMYKNKPKVLVIGLDAGTWKALRPLIDEGVMPNLKNLLEKGVSGDLLSTIPAHSGPAWTSFMTGKNPGKHGIFGFTKLAINGKAKIKISSSKDIKSETIFQILNKANKTAVSVNLPFTYPPFKVNGAMVSDAILTPSKDSNFTYPADLFEKVGYDKKDYILNVRSGYYYEGEELDLLRALSESTDKRAEFALRLMNKINWDLFLVVFTETDKLQHKLFHYVDPSHPFYNDKFKSLINDFFAKLDKIIFSLIDKAGMDTNILIVSDHGFGPIKGTIYINYLLRRLGLLRIKEKWLRRLYMDFRKDLISFLNRKSSLYRNIKKLIKSILNSSNENRAPQDYMKTKAVLLVTNFVSSIDWSKTNAYFAGNTASAIYINSQDNSHNGLGIHEKGKEKNMIIRELKEIQDSVTKTFLNLKVHRKEDIYHGPCLDLAPDLVLDSNSGYKFGRDPYSGKLFHKENRASSDHYREGILVMCGNNIKENKTIENASIMDIAPTILYFLGLAVPTDMDGKVLKDGIKSEFLKRNPILFQESNNAESKEEILDTVYSREDDNEIKLRLADLGYI